MTLEEIVEQTLQLSDADRIRLVERLQGNGSGPPNSVRDLAHLEELLPASVDSPTHPVTDQVWQSIRQEVRRRHSSRKAATTP